MSAEGLQARIRADADEGGRFRELPTRHGLDDTRTEELVDENQDPEDRRLWWAAVQQALTQP